MNYDNEIVNAIQHDDVRKIEELINNGLDTGYQILDSSLLPKKIKSFHPSLLALSSFYNSTSILSFLFKVNSLSKSIDKFNTPISHYAAFNGSTSALTLISENCLEFEGAIFAAIEGKSLKSIKWLKHNGYLNNLELDERGQAISFAAVEADFGKGIKYLVKNCGCQLNPGYEGPPLIFALGHGLWDAALVLIKDLKVNLNDVDGNGNTPLHLACSANHQQIAQAIVYRSPELLKLKNKNGAVPMDLCSDKESLKLEIPDKVNEELNESKNEKDNTEGKKEDTSVDVADSDCSQTCLMV